MKSKLNETQQAILKAAEAEFLHKGYAGARTMSIAAAAGVSHTMLHYYCRTKEELFDKIFEEKLNYVTVELAKSFDAPEGKNVTDRIKNVVESHYTILLNNKELPGMLFTEMKNNPDRMKAMIAKVSNFINGFADANQSILDEAAESGEICKVDFRNLFLDILSLNLISVALGNVFMKLLNMEADAFYEMRRKEVVETILKRIRP